MPVHDVTIWFTPEHVHLAGVVSRVTPFALRIRLHARVWLDGSLPKVVVEDACMGKFAFPGWLKNLTQRVINDTLSDYRGFFSFTELRIGQDEIYVAGQITR
jgi:hypothetical protein